MVSKQIFAINMLSKQIFAIFLKREEKE